MNNQYTLTIERFVGFTTDTVVETRPLNMTEAHTNFEYEAIVAMALDVDTYRVTLTVDDLPCRELRFDDRLAAREG